MKKSLSFGLSATLLLCIASCGHKEESTATATDTVYAVEEQSAPQEAVANDTVMAATLDMLTPEEGIERSTEIHTTPSGLKYRIIKEGTGKSPSAYDVVEVNYEGKNLEGKTFDSSYERNQSATFPLNQVIAGWTEGVQLMKEGAVYEFYIPSNLAYGERGAGQDIAPNSDLLFKVQLIAVK